jgi:hypothetical protein
LQLTPFGPYQGECAAVIGRDRHQLAKSQKFYLSRRLPTRLVVLPVPQEEWISKNRTHLKIFIVHWNHPPIQWHLLPKPYHICIHSCSSPRALISVLPCRSRCALNRVRRYVKVTHRFPLRVVEMFNGIADFKRLPVRIRQWIPDDVEPIAVAQLRGLVRFVRRQRRIDLSREASLLIAVMGRKSSIRRWSISLIAVIVRRRALLPPKEFLRSSGRASKN